MIKWLTENWTTIAGLMGALGTPVAWYTGIKRGKAQTKIVEGDAIQNMQKAYDTFVADQSERYADFKNEIKYLRTELSAVKDENIEQRKDLRKYNLEVNKLRKELAGWKEKYVLLKAEFDKLVANDE